MQLCSPATVVCSRQLGPAASCEATEERQLVRTSFAELRRRTTSVNGRIVHLRWVQQRSASEVAARTNLTARQVWYRTRRLKKKLRQLLITHGYREVEVT
jgi:DNA-directed RNA polymerase specialized sigma24 family protein